MAATILTTYEELAPYHLGRTDNVACNCGRHGAKPFIAIDIRAAQLWAEMRRLGGNRPRQCNGASRCFDKQVDLYRIYHGHSPVAQAKNSTHVVLVEGGKIVRPCFAIDVVNEGTMAAKIRDRDLFRQAGMNLWGKRPRIGWETYANGCCHADVAFFAPWHPAHQPGVEW